MNKTVSVDQAIAKGRYLVNYPTLVIIIGFVGLCVYLTVFEGYSSWGVTIAGIIVGSGLAWLYWSIVITKWRIWAFENVRNVHELKKRAIQEKLIWPDESIFVKTEIRTRQDNKRLLVLFAGIYLLKEGDYYFCVALIAGGSYFAYKEFKEATDKTPQIILNDKGIQTISTVFYKWEKIRNEEVVTARYSKGRSRNYLTYDHPEGSENLLIDDYKINKKSLNKLLTIYRGRSRRGDFQQKTMPETLVNS